MSVNDYDYDKELTSSSLSSTSEQGGRVPKPPQVARTNSNLYSRQRIYKTYAESNTNKVSFDRSDSIDETSIHPNDEVIKILNTTPTSGNRLSKYSALPKISNKIDSGRNSSQSRPASIVSNYTFDYNDLYDDDFDNNILIGLRLPNGTKKQKTFSSTTQLKAVLNFGLNEMEAVDSYKDFDMYTLLQMPNNVIDDLEQTIQEANIKNRSMLFIIEKKRC